MRGPPVGNPTTPAPGIKELRGQIAALSETLENLKVGDESCRNGIVAIAAIVGALAERVSNLEYSQQCAGLDPEHYPEPPENDDIVGRVIAAMETQQVRTSAASSAATAATAAATAPATAATAATKTTPGKPQVQPDASLPPAPPLS